MSVSTSATDAVDAVVDILSNVSSSEWQNADPEVHRRWEKTQKYRENNNDAALYVWSPTETTFTQFEAEYNNVRETQVVEVSCWTLEEPDSASQYADDVVDILEDYATDQNDKTNFVFLRPQTLNDLRQEHIKRRTDHYIVNVQIETERLKDAT